MVSDGNDEKSILICYRVSIELTFELGRKQNRDLIDTTYDGLLREIFIYSRTKLN